MERPKNQHPNGTYVYAAIKGQISDHYYSLLESDVRC